MMRQGNSSGRRSCMRTCDLEDDMVGNCKPEDCWHSPEDRQNSYAEVREWPQVADGALLEFFVRQGKQLCFAFCRPLRRVHRRDAMRDTLQL